MYVLGVLSGFDSSRGIAQQLECSNRRTPGHAVLFRSLCSLCFSISVFLAFFKSRPNPTGPQPQPWPSTTYPPSWATPRQPDYGFQLFFQLRLSVAGQDLICMLCVPHFSCRCRHYSRVFQGDRTLTETHLFVHLNFMPRTYVWKVHHTQFRIARNVTTRYVVVDKSAKSRNTCFCRKEISLHQYWWYQPREEVNCRGQQPTYHSVQKKDILNYILMY